MFWDIVATFFCDVRPIQYPRAISDALSTFKSGIGMENDPRDPRYHVIADLLSQPEHSDFFTAVRRLTMAGYQVRYMPRPSLLFPATDWHHISIDGDVASIHVNFMGLMGVDS